MSFCNVAVVHVLLWSTIFLMASILGGCPKCRPKVLAHDMTADREDIERGKTEAHHRGHLCLLECYEVHLLHPLMAPGVRPRPEQAAIGGYC